MFDELGNTKYYKECLLKAYEAGNKNFCTSIPQYVPLDKERFQCKEMDEFCEIYGYDLDDYAKIEIYLTTIYWIAYTEQMRLAQPTIKVYDPYEDNISGWIVTKAHLNYLQIRTEYYRMRKVDIEGFPKTFETFRKHKEKNSDKYKEWKRIFEGNAHEV